MWWSLVQADVGGGGGRAPAARAAPGLGCAARTPGLERPRTMPTVILSSGGACSTLLRGPLLAGGGGRVGSSVLCDAIPAGLLCLTSGKWPQKLLNSYASGHVAVQHWWGCHCLS